MWRPRLSDFNPVRLLKRLRCHRSLARCQYQDRPNDNQGR
jgi:hypothetical protein